MPDRVEVDVDHHSAHFNEHEVEEWNRIRPRCPVAFNPRQGGFWMVTGYEAVAAVSRDGDTFAHRYDPHADDGIDYVGTMALPRPEGQPALGLNEVDGPHHQELRRALNPFLSPPAVERLRPFMEQTAAWFLDQKVAAGAMDLVYDYTSPVPAVLTLEMFGLPGANWAYYADLFHSTLAYPPDAPQYATAISRVADLLAELTEFAEERRREPGDDLTSFLVQLEVQGRHLTPAEMVDVLWNLVAGGIDTTTSLTSWALHHLAAHPEQRQALIDDPALHATATEEFLRYFSVAQTLTRTVARDVELCGQRLRRNDRLLVSYVGANHDPAEFPDADQVVLDREPNRHLAFGLGPHRCIGSSLARTMFQVLLQGALTRIPDYRLVDPGVRQYLGTPFVTGLVELPVTFTPSAPTGATRPC